MRLSIAISIDSLLVGRTVGLSRLERIVLYFVQLMKRLVVGGDDDTGVHKVSRRIGLWSEDSSLRLSI